MPETLSDARSAPKDKRQRLRILPMAYSPVTTDKLTRDDIENVLIAALDKAFYKDVGHHINEIGMGKKALLEREEWEELMKDIKTEKKDGNNEYELTAPVIQFYPETEDYNLTESAGKLAIFRSTIGKGGIAGAMLGGVFGTGVGLGAGATIGSTFNVGLGTLLGSGIGGVVGGVSGAVAGGVSGVGIGDLVAGVEGYESFTSCLEKAGYGRTFKFTSSTFLQQMDDCRIENKYAKATFDLSKWKSDFIKNWPVDEAEFNLNQMCWIPFEIQSLTVGEEGGTFCLQPEAAKFSHDNDLIKLDVPRNAIDTKVCKELSIQYAILVHGPFVLKEGLKLASHVVYLDFNPEHISQSSSLYLHLPHWANEKDDVYVAVSPHNANNEYEYKFYLQNNIVRLSSKTSTIIPISGHCSLFANAVKVGCLERFMLFSYPTEESLKVIITYDSIYWYQIVQKEWHADLNEKAVPINFQPFHIFIEADLPVSSGPGWWACLEGTQKLAYAQFDFKKRGLCTAKQLKSAVRAHMYPPMFKCITHSGDAAKTEGQRRPVEVVIVDSDGGTSTEVLARFYITVYELENFDVGRTSVPPVLGPQAPTLKDLDQHVIPYIAADWSTVAIHLDIEAPTRDIIQADNPHSVEKCCRQMFDKWLRRFQGTGRLPRTWESVSKALTNAGHGTVAVNLPK